MGGNVFGSGTRHIVTVPRRYLNPTVAKGTTKVNTTINHVAIDKAIENDSRLRS